MEDDYFSIKIKDGLFIGNKCTASDLEFLLANRFKYVLNCTSQVKNYFQSSSLIKYYKLKYSKVKSDQLLWKDNLKKLHMAVQFISSAQQDAECCLIHSNDGNNRSVAVATAYLMVRFKWSLQKTLQFLAAKDVDNKVSPNYMKQLRQLSQTLSLEGELSTNWEKSGLSDQQLVLSNTYKNSIQIPFTIITKQAGKSKKIQWKDRLDKLQKSKKQETKEQPKEKIQKVDKVEKVEKVEKRPTKSVIPIVKKDKPKQQTKESKEPKQSRETKASYRPSSSFSKSIPKKPKEDQLSERHKGPQRDKSESGSSIEDQIRKNRLVNNFMDSIDQPKRASKMAPRKSEDNIKMLRAFSQKEYTSFKDIQGRSSCNIKQQGPKLVNKTKDSKNETSKTIKSVLDNKGRVTSPKTNSFKLHR